MRLVEIRLCEGRVWAGETTRCLGELFTSSLLSHVGWSVKRTDVLNESSVLMITSGPLNLTVWVILHDSYLYRQPWYLMKTCSRVWTRNEEAFHVLNWLSKHFKQGLGSFSFPNKHVDVQSKSQEVIGLARVQLKLKNTSTNTNKALQIRFFALTLFWEPHDETDKTAPAYIQRTSWHNWTCFCFHWSVRTEELNVLQWNVFKKHN